MSDEECEEFITEEHALYLQQTETSNLFPYETENDIQEQEDSLNIFSVNPKEYKTVKYYTKGVNNPDTEYVEYELKYLGSYGRTNVVDRMQSNIKTLHTLKKNGQKVGRLRYVSDYTSITYKKRGYGFDINIGNSTMRLQGCKKWFKVFGMD